MIGGTDRILRVDLPLDGPGVERLLRRRDSLDRGAYVRGAVLWSQALERDATDASWRGPIRPAPYVQDYCRLERRREEEEVEELEELGGAGKSREQVGHDENNEQQRSAQSAGGGAEDTV